MAVKLEGTIRRYIGQSTDDKPMPDVGENFAAGSSFMETDTGTIYRYDGAAWRAATIDDELAQIMAVIVVQLDEMLTILRMATVT